MALSRIGTSADLTAIFARSSYAAASLPMVNQQQHHRAGKLHVSVIRQYPEAPRIPLPSNVSEIFNIETSRFAPERVRDINTPMVLFSSKIGASAGSPGSSESSSAFANNVKMRQMDSHVDSYDCFGAVSLSGAMQTNVPKPFCSNGRSTFLNMPGGQWARDGKYLAEDMRKAHFNVYKMRNVHRYGGLDGLVGSLTIRGYATAAAGSNSSSSSSSKESDSGKQKPTGQQKISQAEWMMMSKRERLQAIIRDYGRTVIVFHVGISLVSLGVFYGLVSSGLDVTPMIKMFSSADKTDGASEQLVAKIMSGGSTFLIAYGIHKLFAPLRISATLVCTPILVKFLRKRGILKPPKLAAVATVSKTG